MRKCGGRIKCFCNDFPRKSAFLLPQYKVLFSVKHNKTGPQILNKSDESHTLSFYWTFIRRVFWSRMKIIKLRHFKLKVVGFLVQNEFIEFLNLVITTALSLLLFRKIKFMWLVLSTHCWSIIYNTVENRYNILWAQSLRRALFLQLKRKKAAVSF